jgi:hypothetical protein
LDDRGLPTKFLSDPSIHPKRSRSRSSSPSPKRYFTRARVESGPSVDNNDTRRPLANSQSLNQLLSLARDILIKNPLTVNEMNQRLRNLDVRAHFQRHLVAAAEVHSNFEEALSTQINAYTCIPSLLDVYRVADICWVHEIAAGSVERPFHSSSSTSNASDARAPTAKEEGKNPSDLYIEDVLLILVRLRTGLVCNICSLCHFSLICKQTWLQLELLFVRSASTLCESGLRMLNVMLQCFVPFHLRPLTAGEMEQHTPPAFVQSLRALLTAEEFQRVERSRLLIVAAAVDCVTVETECSSAADIRTETFSHHKQYHGAKLLAAAAADSQLVALTGPYRPSSNDGALLTAALQYDPEWRRWLEQLGDNVLLMLLGDRNFTSPPASLPSNVNLLIPARLSGEVQFSADDAARDRVLSSLRFVIECSFSLTHRFQLLSSAVPLLMLPDVMKYVRLAAAISNAFAHPHLQQDWQPTYAFVTDSADD